MVPAGARGRCIRGGPHRRGRRRVVGQRRLDLTGVNSSAELAGRVALRAARAARSGRATAHPDGRRLRARGLPDAVRRQLSPFVVEAIEAFDVLVANGVDAPVTDAPITALFRSTEAAERMVRELRALENAGQTMSVTGLAGEALREQVPLASPAITAALSINGQRFVDPGRFVHALGQAVMERGATMRTLEVRSVFSSGSGTTVYPRSGM